MIEPAPPGPTDERIARLSRLILRRQAALSVRIATIFLAILLALPLFNALLPDAANYPIYGMPASWLFLAVLFYPVTVGLSVAFVRRSDRIESECRAMAESGGLR